MEESLLYNPKSLYKTCLNFVSKNVGYIESLDSFPSSIGEEIFHTCLAVESLNENNDDTVQALQKFVEAYSFDFINSIKCNNILFISNYEECFLALLLPVRELDLSNCELGNCSSLLSYLHQLNNLSVLNLSNNRLSDKGFRNIFLPFKVYKNGFRILKSLDLSGNEVSVHSLRGILILPNLTKLCVTIPQISDVYVNNITVALKNKGFTLDVANERKDLLGIKNNGWASLIISKWECLLSEIQSKRKVEVKPKNARQFYRNIFKINSVIQEIPETHLPKKDRLFTYIKVEKSGTVISDKSSPLFKNIVKNPNNKRTLESSLDESTFVKRKSYADGKAELFDLELLNLYLKK